MMKAMSSTEASCITEMSLMMACWKQSNFVDGLCTNEIQQFYTCVAKAQVCSPFCHVFMSVGSHHITSCDPTGVKEDGGAAEQLSARTDDAPTGHVSA